MTADGAGRPVDLLAPAAHLALAVARRDAASPEAPPPPTRLRPFLSFRRPLPTRAVAAALAVLDEDATFRARVAEAFEEVGAGGAPADAGISDDRDADAGGVDPGGVDAGDVDAGDVDERVAPEVGGDADETVVEAVRAFLLRPDGWEGDLAALTQRSASAARAREQAAADRSAVRRVAQLEAALERVRTEADGLRARLDDERAARQAAEERAERTGADLVAARSDLADAEHRRARAVQDLAAARALAAERLEELRRSGPAGPAAPPVTPSATAPAAAAAAAATAAAAIPQEDPGPDLAAASRVLRRAGEVADELRALVREASEGLGVTPPTPTTSLSSDGDPGTAGEPAPATSGHAGRGPRPTRPRRSPVGLRRGVIADTADAVDQLLRVPRMVAVVDGYNVSMAGWPALDRGGQRDQLIRLLSEVVARTGAEVHAVFDGDADGRRPSVFAPMPVRVHFSAAGVEADEVVLDLVARLPLDRPVLVVSSDRAVRDGAARRGADTTSSSSLLDWWRR